MLSSVKFPIGRKFLLGALATTVLAVLAAGTINLVIDLRDFRGALVQRYTAQAEVLAKLSVAALEFDDPAHARLMLDNLKTDRDVRAVSILRPDGSRFASYGSAGAAPAGIESGFVVDGQLIHVSTPVAQGGQRIGTLRLSGSYPVEQRLVRSLENLATATLISLLLALLMSLWLKRVVSNPIRALTVAVLEVISRRDFSRRVAKTTADEVGVLVDAVNGMLGELGARAGEIEEHNRSLRAEVEARRKAEAALVELNESLEARVLARTDELARANEQLRHSQKMQAIGQLTGGVAHDFNNVLQVVAGNLQLLALQGLPGEEAQRRLSTAALATERGARLANQLLAFARRQPLQPAPTNLGRVLRTIDDMIRRAIGDSIEVETVVAGGLWNTMVDPHQLENVILNLAINARDAMQGEGRLTLELGNAMLDDHYASSEQEVAPGQYVMLAISDTGCGMPPDVIERAFEPFFTTKREGEGTGLGLSMAFGFVKQSGGHIKIYSEVGVGTTIKLYLPRSHAEEVARVSHAEGPVVGGSETVLVVEDDLAVQMTAVDTLEKLGYTVLKANDAGAALVILESGVTVDFLFTDVVMPGPVRSPELARRAREINPAIVVLFTSGYTQNAIVHGGRLDPGVELISKPYRREDLARKIRALLDKAPRPAAAALPMPEPLPLTEAAADGPAVLVVDDDADNLALMSELLAMLGARPSPAGDGAAALRLAQDRRFDVLLTDLNMPGIGGAELARRLRAQLPQLRVMFASGYGRVAQTGIDDALWLPKPCRVEDLEAMLQGAGTAGRLPQA